MYSSGLYGGLSGGSSGLRPGSKDPISVSGTVLCLIKNLNKAWVIWIKKLRPPSLPQADREFFILLPRAKIDNLPASANFLQFPPLFSMMFYVIKA
jgi:hypothetical protein